MTSDLFAKAIDEQPITIEPTTYVVDWGTLRGQGRRSAGMVMGSMFDVTIQGKKTYTNPFGNLPEAQDAEVRREWAMLNPADETAYLKGRSYGLDHEAAMRWVYEKRGDAEPGFTHAYIQETCAATRGKQTYVNGVLFLL